MNNNEEVKKDGKIVYCIKSILSGVLDQVFAILLAMLIFGLAGLVLRVFQYQFASNLKEDIFLVIYIISNVFYYPMTQQILNGKTLARKLIFK